MIKFICKYNTQKLIAEKKKKNITPATGYLLLQITDQPAGKYP